MALIVEDGTGLVEADSYLSVADFRDRAARIGYDVTGFADQDVEPALREAAEYIDTFARYRSTRLKADQEREFPRADLTDWSGHPVTGVPLRVKKAAVELAYRVLQGVSLYEDQRRGGKVVSETVGPISTTYAADAPAGTTYTAVERLLAPFVRNENPAVGAPFFSTSEAPAFEVDDFDYSSGDTAGGQ